ncbi:hypothetical protein B0H13DRAFT_2251862 [Mycena leptocephala]|nr:hypothetical protein B0H13DRAFT_2251862 [Mycena leptocephala]
MALLFPLSDNTRYSDEHITATFHNRGSAVDSYEFQTKRTVGKTGLMMIGVGGNNGSTLCATILANRHNITWHTKSGMQQPNYIGSVLRASTVRIGTEAGTGWDISGLPMDKAMERARVLDWDLQRQVAPHMALLGKPLPSIYYPDFIAANQRPHIRADIRRFREDNSLDRCVVFWTANTERYSDIIPGVNDTADNLLAAIKASHSEGEPFVNGAPQNTFVPGVIELAERHQSFIGGDDLKSGQTKLKSVLAEFLVNAGIKPLSIASYNHLGNNDGHNLSAEPQFKSKEISKSSVVDDMVDANRLLYKAPEIGPKGIAAGKGEHPDHIVVIKYVPAVGDSKRAIDEYYSEIFCGGRSTINIFNECEDSLLATPLILDLAILTELLTRVQYRKVGSSGAGAEPTKFAPLYPVLSLLSYMLKAPLVKPGTEVVNSLNRQRNALETLFSRRVSGWRGTAICCWRRAFGRRR